MLDPNPESPTVETTTPPAPADSNSQDDNTPAETTAPAASADKPNDQIDYRAELEAANERLRQAEHNIVQTKRENKELKKSQTSSTLEPNLDPVYQTQETAADIEARIARQVDERLTKVTAEITADTFEEELETASPNPDERALIKFHYENSIKQSGRTRKSIRADLATAKVLANQKRLATENGELKEALKAKHAAAKKTIGTNQDPLTTEDPGPQFSEADRSVIERRAQADGLTFKEYVRRHPELKPN